MMRALRSNQRGQSLTEYVMLMAVVAGMGRLIFSGLPKLLKTMEMPLRSEYARVYKYGDPEACGYENDPPGCDGSPKRHPRYRIEGGTRMIARGK